MQAEPHNRSRTIAITGASAGLGAALARAYAAPGIALGLLARRGDLLEQVAAECRARGATVVSSAGDVADAVALKAWLGGLDARHGLDLVIVNAGIFDGCPRDGLESDSVAQAILSTNLAGAIATASAAAALMLPRRAGRIALVASLAARHPLADAPVYSASKAGLIAYGEALRERLAPKGVGVSLVLPGHVATAQIARHRGPLPFLMPAEAAAQRIRRGLDRSCSTVAFPARLAWLIGAGRWLPWQLRAMAARSQRFTVDPDGSGTI